MTAVFSLCLGLSSWTLLEYLLHRFVFHERIFGIAAAREHTRHHGRVSWFAPWSSKLKLAAILLPPIFLAAALLGGLSTAVPLLSGLVAGWLAYEHLHRRIHTHAPISAYGRWARRHHLAHHLEDPSKNHGVTSPLWDWVFGTLVRSDVVEIPIAHLARFPWLVSEDVPGEAPQIASRWASTYRVRRPTRA